MLKQKSRKIQEVNGSFLLTIPRFWADQFGLKKSDELELATNENQDLVILAPKTKQKETPAAAAPPTPA